MTLSALTAWMALALIPLTALTAWWLRRFARGRFVQRLRPHYLLGYACAGFAGVHLWLSMGAFASTSGLGINLATAAFGALLLQAFLGASLQSPGAFRLPLRRWHVAIFIAASVLSAGHVLLNGPFAL